jgi:hypothetical protein
MTVATTTVRATIRGICPLKMDRYHGLADPKTPQGYKDQAVHKVYLDDDGFIGIPSSAIKAVIREASSELGKKMESRKNRQRVQAGVFFPKQVFATLPKREEPDGIAEDLATRKGQGAKVTRVITYRPFLKEWSVDVEMFLFDLQSDFVKEALELGGLRYGLLSHRPEFGRFLVEKFEVVGEEVVGEKKKKKE